MRCIPALATLSLILAVRVAAADPYKAGPGPYPVAALELEWKDASRDVTVPVKIYYPKNLADLKAPPPLIIFSHGLGGSREGYKLWGEQWASNGYIVVHPTHIGSDSSIFLGAMEGTGANAAGGAARGAGLRGREGEARGTLMQSAANAENAVRRVKDVSFVIDQMEKANAGTLAGTDMAVFGHKIDMKHIGMAGHSFGAQTTLSIAGEMFRRGGTENSGADPRVTAAIAMSPQPAILANQKIAFGSIKIPVLHITGTDDNSPPGLGEVKPADRRVPFDNSPFPDTYLIIFQGATHMTFAPTAGGQLIEARARDLRGSRGDSPAQEAAIHTLVEESTTAFWDAFLKENPQAKAWLRNDCAKELGSTGTFASKTK